jgi:hypothetical protein
VIQKNPPRVASDMAFGTITISEYRAGARQHLRSDEDARAHRLDANDGSQFLRRGHEVVGTPLFDVNENG